MLKWTIDFFKSFDVFKRPIQMDIDKENIR